MMTEFILIDGSLETTYISTTRFNYVYLFHPMFLLAYFRLNLKCAAFSGKYIWETIIGPM